MPGFPGGATYLLLSFVDPAARLEAFRGIRDLIDGRFRSWLGEV